MHPLTATILQVLDWPMQTTGGYNFVSGIGSDIGEITVVGLGVAWLHHHNCHVAGCWRLHWRPTAAGDLVCRRHHPEKQKTHEQILDDHHAALEIV